MSKFTLTEKQIRGWGGDALFTEAEKQYYLKGDVLRATFEAPYGEADISHAGHTIRTRFKVSPSGLVENLCPCAVSQRDGRVCVHIVAAAIMLNRRAVAAAHLMEKEQEREHAEKVITAQQQGGTIVRDYINGQPAEVRIRLPENWHEAFLNGEMPITCSAILAGGGSPIALDYIAQRKIALRPGRVDDTILFVLEDIQEGDMTRPVVLTRADFIGIVDMLGANGRPIYRSGGNPIVVEKTPLESKLVIDLDRDTGEILMMLTTEIPGVPEGTVPQYVVFGNKGFAYHDGVFWPLKSVLPGLYQKVYLETISVPRKGTLAFLKNELEFLSD